mgnify:CR=1 FL=1
MKLLVTGGLGFIGSNFILHLIKNYPDIFKSYVGSNLSPRSPILRQFPPWLLESVHTG